MLIIVFSKQYCVLNTIFWTRSWHRHRRCNCASVPASGQAQNRHACAPCTRRPQPQLRSCGALRRRGRKGGGPLAAAAAVEQMEEGRRGRPRACCRPPAGCRGSSRAHAAGAGPGSSRMQGRAYTPPADASARVRGPLNVPARRARSVGRRSSGAAGRHPKAPSPCSCARAAR